MASADRVLGILRTHEKQSPGGQVHPWSGKENSLPSVRRRRYTGSYRAYIL